MNININELTFETDVVKSITKSFLEKIDLDMRINNIEFDLREVLNSNYITFKDIARIIERYNLDVSKITKMILIPIYNVPMI